MPSKPAETTGPPCCTGWPCEMCSVPASVTTVLVRRVRRWAASKTDSPRVAWCVLPPWPWRSLRVSAACGTRHYPAWSRLRQPGDGWLVQPRFASPPERKE